VEASIRNTIRVMPREGGASSNHCRRVAQKRVHYEGAWLLGRPVKPGDDNREEQISEGGP
jgi:hypothetical protein